MIFLYLLVDLLLDCICVIFCRLLCSLLLVLLFSFANKYADSCCGSDRDEHVDFDHSRIPGPNRSGVNKPCSRLLNCVRILPDRVPGMNRSGRRQFRRRCSYHRCRCYSCLRCNRRFLRLCRLCRLRLCRQRCRCDGRFRFGRLCRFRILRFLFTPENI